MKSMRDFIAGGEEKGLVKRITAEVDWNLELSHIAKLNEEKKGPALLFENVKGYDSPIITSTCTTTERLAIIMGMPKETPLVELMRHWVEIGSRKIPPKLLETGPCKENKMMGDEVDLFKFPVPKFFPLDGGRYFGTAHCVITRDPDEDWVNHNDITFTGTDFGPAPGSGGSDSTVYFGTTAAATGDIVSYQPQYNLLDRSNREAMRYAREQGLGVVGMGRIGQRPDEIENRSNAHLLPQPGHMTHGIVEKRRKHQADADFLKTSLHIGA